MSIRRNLIRGRSHIVIVIVLIVAATIVVRIEDATLKNEMGKPIPDDSMLSGAQPVGHGLK